MSANRPTANKALVRAWFTALSELRFADAWALDDPGGFMWLPAPREKMLLCDWHPAYERLIAQQFPNGGVQFELGPMTAEEDRVSVLTSGRGTLRDGAEYDNLHHWLFVADGTRITEIWEYMDTLHAQQTTRGYGWQGPMVGAS